MPKSNLQDSCYQIENNQSPNEELSRSTQFVKESQIASMMEKSLSISDPPIPNGYAPINMSGAYVIDSMKGLVASEFCDITMTLNYLFISNDFEVLDCLGAKLREFDVNLVSCHLLQLLQLYIKADITSHFIYKYVSFATERNVRFSLLCSWMLDALIKDNVIVNSLVNERIKLLNEEITINNVYSSKSIDADSDTSLNSPNKSIFIDSKLFYSKLVKIGSFLLSTKHSDRSAILQMCIFKMNSIISDGLFIPWVTYPEHRILQISPYYATVLNSKERVPFMICVEVLETSQDMDNDLKKLLKFNRKTTRSSEIERFLLSSNINDCTATFLDDTKLPSTSANSELSEQTELSNQKSALSDIQASTKPSHLKPKFISHHKVKSEPYMISAKQIRDKLLVNDSPPTSRENSLSLKHAAMKKVAINNDMSDDSLASMSSSVLSFSRLNQAYESWSQKVDHIRKMSPFSYLKGWNVYSVIVKCGDDLRQDLLAYQLLRKCQEVWEIEKTGLWIKPYEITIISNDCGLIEVINDSVSLHQLKKTTKKTLLEYFESIYGSKNEDTLLNAQKNFIKSLAAYSIFQYVFRIKDRHNSNIMLDQDGHIIHIDFGYMLAITPKNLSFETSPFKMTNEYIELMNGLDSDLFLYFRALMFHGLFALQKHMDKFIHLVQIMLDSNIPCVGSNPSVISALKSRFHANMPDEAFSQVVDSLINKSIRSITTRLYDRYQYFANGIL